MQVLETVAKVHAYHDMVWTKNLRWSYERKIRETWQHHTYSFGYVGAREDEADVRVPKVAGGLSELAVAK